MITLFHSQGEFCATARWVLVVDPEGHVPPGAFFSTDFALAPAQIVEWFVLRWHVDVTFEEGRRHLGVETQRQWSEQVIVLSSPLGLSAPLSVRRGAPRPQGHR